MNAPSPASAATSSKRPPSAIERYYRLHSRIYDATRWSFLFGRSTILDRIATLAQPKRILEVGCGTGRNLAPMARLFDRSVITGVDMSSAMLDIARRKSTPYGHRIQLLHQPYRAPLGGTEGFDLILFSYALSMFNPGWESAIDTAHEDLAPGGHLAVVDFHDSRHPSFKRWMGVNHVRMEGHLRPTLQSVTEPIVDETKPAYGGVWEYALFVGKKRR